MQVGREIRSSGVTRFFMCQEASGLQTSLNSSMHLLILLCELQERLRQDSCATAEQLLSSWLSLAFSLSTFLRQNTETKRLTKLCWNIIHICDRSAFLHPNQTVLQPLGREHIAKQKCEHAAASSTAKGSLTDETLPSQLLPALRSQPVEHLLDAHR